MGLAMDEHREDKELPRVHLQKSHSGTCSQGHGEYLEGHWEQESSWGLSDVTDTCYPSASSLFQAPQCLTGPPSGATYVWVSLMVCGLHSKVGCPHLMPLVC